jgi:hypothetical protein
MFDKIFGMLNFSTEFLSEALLCSLAGMVGIFVVVGIIILSVAILNKAGSRPKTKEDK